MNTSLNFIDNCKVIIGYTTMCCDIIHYGHINFLKKAKENCDFLIVGLHSDEDITLHKRKPVFNIEERKTILESCKYVDKIIINAPYIITDDFMNNLNANVFIYATLNDDENNNYLKEYLLTNKLKKINYTNNISTTNIINYILNNYK